MMKKVVGTILVLAVSILISDTVFAEDQTIAQKPYKGTGMNDAGSNSICDYCNNDFCNGFVDTDKDGACDNWGHQKHHHSVNHRGGRHFGINSVKDRGVNRENYFVDENQDGRCDNCTVSYGGSCFCRKR